MLSGFLGLGVKVNAQAANVAIGIGQNGTFERGAVPLAMGANTLTATATDTVGNTSTQFITVHRVPLSGPRMAVVSGDAQTAQAHEKLASPHRRQNHQRGRHPFAGKVVTFNVTRSDGRLSATGLFGDPSDLMLQGNTDAAGFATAYWDGCQRQRRTLARLLAREERNDTLRVLRVLRNA